VRHNKSGRKFGRTASHRQAMTRNMVTSLLRAGRIETTEAKAKELRRWVEKVITTAKADDLAARRAIANEVTDPAVAERLFTTYVPRFKDRPGGYTRIMAKGPRLGDAAPMVLIELLD
jgi:large subunit ribosomal protein L17